MGSSEVSKLVSSIFLWIVSVANSLFSQSLFLGTGGHLHHVGVVLREALITSVLTPTTVAPNSAVAAVSAKASPDTPGASTYLEVLSLCQQHRMAECGMLQYYDSSLGAQHSRQSNIALLTGEINPISYMFPISHLIFVIALGSFSQSWSVLCW